MKPNRCDLPTCSPTSMSLVAGSKVDVSPSSCAMLTTDLPATVPLNAMTPSSGAISGVPRLEAISTPLWPEDQRVAGRSNALVIGASTTGMTIRVRQTPADVGGLISEPSLFRMGIALRIDPVAEDAMISGVMMLCKCEGDDCRSWVDNVKLLAVVAFRHDAAAPAMAYRCGDDACKTTGREAPECQDDAERRPTDMTAIQIPLTSLAVDITLPLDWIVVLSTNRCGPMYLHRVMAAKTLASRLRTCGQKRGNDHAGMVAYTDMPAWEDSINPGNHHGYGQSDRASVRIEIRVVFRVARDEEQADHRDGEHRSDGDDQPHRHGWNPHDHQE